MLRRDGAPRSRRSRAGFRTLALVFVLVLATAMVVLARKPASRKATSSPAQPATSASVAPEVAVARWMASLTLRERIAQLIVIPFNGHPFHRAHDESKFVRLVSQEHIGGLILVNLANGKVVAKADPLQSARFINRMQRLRRCRCWSLAISSAARRCALNPPLSFPTPWLSPRPAIRRKRA